MWYLIVDGIRLPTPYLTLEQARQAMDELRSVYIDCCMDIIREPYN